MQFGKIWIEEKELKYHFMMKTYAIPCGDIKWAYRRVEDSRVTLCCGVGTISTNYVRIMTRQGKRHQFEMPEDEAKACLIYLKEQNPELIVGYPKGAPLPLKSVSNTRDLGGFKAGENKIILPCQLLRSGDLHNLSPEDAGKLKEEYRLHTVIDLRTEAECAQKPDAVISGVNYVKLPVLSKEALGITRETEPLEMIENLGGNPEEYMMSMYRKLILEPECQKQYREFFQILLSIPENGSVLWHCTAGKDRAGVAAMLLLSALGVPQKTIMEDYMRTNKCLNGELEQLKRLMQERNAPDEVVERAKSVLGAKEAYLQAAVNAARSEYGSMESYLEKAMGLAPASIAKLKGRYFA